MTTRLFPILFLALATLLHADGDTKLQNAKISGTSAVTGGTFTINSGAAFTAASGSAVDLSAATTLTLGTNQIAWAAVNKTGSSLADLATRSASDLSSGTLAIARGGLATGTAPGNGKLPIGKTDGTYAIANLTAGSGITITNGDGTITLSADATTTFLALTDTPATYSGHGGKVVKVNAGATALEFVSPAAGGEFDGHFTDLLDAPSSYTGHGGKLVRVKADVSGLEFFTDSAADVPPWVTDHADTAPASPHADDDEFEDAGTLPGGGSEIWTWHAQNSATAGIADGKLTVTTGVTNGNLVAFTNAVGSVGSDWTISAKVNLYNSSSGNEVCGIMLTDGTKISDFSTNGFGTLYADRWTNSTTYSSQPATAALNFPRTVYMRFRRTSGTIYYEWSVEGHYWQLFYSEAEGAYLGTITKAGIFLFDNSSNSKPVTVVAEWFRRE